MTSSATPPLTETAHQQETPARRRSLLRDLPFLAVVAVVLALIIKAFFVQAFFIPSGSMERTLHGCPGCHGDRVLVNKVLYDVRGVHRGDIVVFDGKHTDFPPETTTGRASTGLVAGIHDLQRFLGLGAPNETDFIKRVIGLPGDQVQCCTDGHVVVNGKSLNETYVFEDDHMPFCAASADDLNPNAPATMDQCGPGAKPFVVPRGRLFVLGDHRGASADSRYHGTIPESAVIGRAFVKVWPISRWGLLEVPKTFNSTTASSSIKPMLDASERVSVATDPSWALGAVGALPLALLRRRLVLRRRRHGLVKAR